jgi:non-ribosomal peptide synthetase component E (peptide arylation enzyme)
MPSAEDYRRKAEEADAKAAVARDADVRLTFQEIARQWRELAAQMERAGIRQI